MPSSEGLPRKDAGLHPTRAVLVCAEPLCYRGAFPNGDPQVPARDGCSLFQKENPMFVVPVTRELRPVPTLPGGSGLARRLHPPRRVLPVLLRPLPCSCGCTVHTCGRCAAGG
ncbi:hypothetical protein D8B29_22785 [Verminephrobacter eiseniae]|nr:hypothetical protein [Verminephrobacter eiseniae]MCW5284094.1 hypothetical protein [Verminephrobacter eiseniae]MCW5301802.1 hypothetical protein [Verminephrobacter eiseniae]MCW8182288.1 hypothetical protein [Verminephrobacter eiseniae]MCW8192954.1 hypothetical protein [Verminephrobacter eiseniae]